MGGHWGGGMGRGRPGTPQGLRGAPTHWGRLLACGRPSPFHAPPTGCPGRWRSQWKAWAAGGFKQGLENRGWGRPRLIPSPAIPAPLNPNPFSLPLLGDQAGKEKRNGPGVAELACGGGAHSAPPPRGTWALEAAAQNFLKERGKFGRSHKHHIPVGWAKS